MIGLYGEKSRSNTDAEQISAAMTHHGSVGAKLPFTTIGYVEDNDDPEQLGRLKVFCPAVDAEVHTPYSLPWARYVSPFAGTTEDAIIGPSEDVLGGAWAYGFWAIPKIGSHVLVMFIDGEAGNRIWFGGLMAPPLGKSMLGGLTTNDKGEPGSFSEDIKANSLLEKQQKTAGLNSSTVWKTRGAYERQVGADIFDGSEGYTVNRNNKQKLESQVIGLTTPGRHYLTMSDTPEHCRVRLRTTTGHQIIMDDSNERIYISTSEGNSWIEMDNDGHVHVYSGASLSVHAQADINLDADGGIFMNAKSIHMTSEDFSNTSCCNNTLASDGLFLSGGSKTHISGGPELRMSGGKIDLNGPAAEIASAATKPVIVPGKEPWARPKSTKQRGKYWKA